MLALEDCTACWVDASCDKIPGETGKRQHVLLFATARQQDPEDVQRNSDPAMWYHNTAPPVSVKTKLFDLSSSLPVLADNIAFVPHGVKLQSKF